MLKLAAITSALFMVLDTSMLHKGAEILWSMNADYILALAITLLLAPVVKPWFE